MKRRSLKKAAAFLVPVLGVLAAGPVFFPGAVWAEEETQAVSGAENAAAASAGTAVFSSGEYEYYLNGDGTATLCGYSGSGTDMAIPDEIDGYPVGAVGDSVFEIYRNSLAEQIKAGQETVIMQESDRIAGEGVELEDDDIRLGIVLALYADRILPQESRSGSAAERALFSLLVQNSVNIQRNELYEQAELDMENSTQLNEFYADGTRAAVSDDFCSYLFDTETGMLLFQSSDACYFDPDAEYCVTACTENGEHCFSVFDVDSGTEIDSFREASAGGYALVLYDEDIHTFFTGEADKDNGITDLYRQSSMGGKFTDIADEDAAREAAEELLQTHTSLLSWNTNSAYNEIHGEGIEESGYEEKVSEYTYPYDDASETLGSVPAETSRILKNTETGHAAYSYTGSRRWFYNADRDYLISLTGEILAVNREYSEPLFETDNILTGRTLLNDAGDRYLRIEYGDSGDGCGMVYWGDAGSSPSFSEEIMVSYYDSALVYAAESMDRLAFLTPENELVVLDPSDPSSYLFTEDFGAGGETVTALALNEEGDEVFAATEGSEILVYRVLTGELLERISVRNPKGNRITCLEAGRDYLIASILSDSCAVYKKTASGSYEPEYTIPTPYSEMESTGMPRYLTEDGLLFLGTRIPGGSKGFEGAVYNLSSGQKCFELDGIQECVYDSGSGYLVCRKWSRYRFENCAKIYRRNEDGQGFSMTGEIVIEDGDSQYEWTDDILEGSLFLLGTGAKTDVYDLETMKKLYSFDGVHFRIKNNAVCDMESIARNSACRYSLDYTNEDLVRQAEEQVSSAGITRTLTSREKMKYSIDSSRFPETGR